MPGPLQGLFLGNSVFPSGGADPAWEHSWLCWFPDVSAFQVKQSKGRLTGCCLLLTSFVKIVNFLTINTTVWENMLGLVFLGGGKGCVYVHTRTTSIMQTGGVKCFIATFCNFSRRSDLNKILQKIKKITISAISAAAAAARGRSVSTHTGVTAARYRHLPAAGGNTPG